MSNELSEEILAIWFPEFDENECVPAKYQQRWWVRDTSFDAMLTQKFQSHVVLAGQGKYDDWLTTSRSGLALIILLDQFSRNIFRGTVEMFAQDEHARNCAKCFLDAGLHHSLKLAEQVFVYMPFEHSEQWQDHEFALNAFQALVDQANNDALKKDLQNALDFEKRHAVMIKRFGRYPYRNELLGRKSTEDELIFLTAEDAGFL